jgi:hypothetical protein
MTEEDTFNRLRGLTRMEARYIYDYLYDEAMIAEGTVTIQDVRDWVNRGLRPYGWSMEQLEGKDETLS